MKKRLAAILFFCLVLLPARAGNIYLISVGVADYPGYGRDLCLPANDAKVVYRLYKDYQNATTLLLTNKNATVSLVKKEASLLFKKAKEDDLVIFFFSGHGYKGGFMAYDGPLSYDDIRSIFKNCKASRKMIFADACFSGEIRDNGNNSTSTTTYSKDDVMLFLSSRSGETSMESPDMTNGFFTSCLVRCLRGGADANRDKVITAKELFTAVRDGVIDLSDGEQHPVMWGNFEDNMIVMSWK